MKTIKRNWLKKQIELGKVEAKCNYRYTDDYAFDNAYDFQKTGWMPARISHPKVETRMMPWGPEDHYTDIDMVDGCINFREYQFEGKAGGAYDDGDGFIHLYMHSNESYTLRIKA